MKSAFAASSSRCSSPAARRAATGKAVIAKALRIIDADGPYVVLFVVEDIHVYNADLNGFHPNATTPFDDFLAVDI